jgi:hypothetical protein
LDRLFQLDVPVNNSDSIRHLYQLADSWLARMSSVQLSGAGVAAVAFNNNNSLRPSQTSALRVGSSRRLSRSLVVKAATVVTPKVKSYGNAMYYAHRALIYGLQQLVTVCGFNCSIPHSSLWETECL